MDFWLYSIFLWHPICFHWPWYGCMKINVMESVWKVNIGRNSRMCTFVDLYEDHEEMKWKMWIWWMDLCKDPKWMEGMKGLDVEYKDLKWM